MSDDIFYIASFYTRKSGDGRIEIKRMYALSLDEAIGIRTKEVIDHEDFSSLGSIVGLSHNVDEIEKERSTNERNEQT